VEISRDLTCIFLCQFSVFWTCSAAAKFLTKAKPQTSPELCLYSFVLLDKSMDRQLLVPFMKPEQLLRGSQWTKEKSPVETPQEGWLCLLERTGHLMQVYPGCTPGNAATSAELSRKQNTTYAGQPILSAAAPSRRGQLARYQGRIFFPLCRPKPIPRLLQKLVLSPEPTCPALQHATDHLTLVLKLISYHIPQSILQNETSIITPILDKIRGPERYVSDSEAEPQCLR